jgi:hypothetical protein
MQFNYTSFTNFEYIIDRLKDLDYTQPDIPIGYPSVKDVWHRWDADNFEFIPVSSVPAGTIVTDVESVNSNKTLALASAFHLELRTWFVFFASSKGEGLIRFEDETLIAAHRVCFEMSFIANTYDPITYVKGICTHSLASLRLHPLKEGLMRSNPKIPWFKESSLLDLAGLYNHFTGKKMDKSFVQIFIDSDEEQWLDLDFSNTVIKKSIEKQRKKLKKEGLSEEEILKLAPDVIYEGDEHIMQAFRYNYLDVAATVCIIEPILEFEINPYVFLGLLHGSTPIMYLDSQWYSHIQAIEDLYNQIKEDLLLQAEKIQRLHIETSGSWDGQDWNLWTKAAKLKAGLPKWFDPKKVGITRKETAIALRLHWLNKPLKRIEAMNPDKPGDKEKLYWHTLESKEGDVYEEVMGENRGAEIFDNPTNISGKFKNIVSFFGAKFEIYWKQGILTSSLAEGQELIQKQVSTTFWTSIRTRLLSLFIKKIHGNLITIPRPSLAAAVSGRSVDRVWLVLSKLIPTKVGSETQGLVKAPSGWKLVNFDLDSCQLRIFAVMCDAKLARELCARKTSLLQTEFSKAAILGDKKKFTSIAHEIAKSAGYDANDPANMEKGYLVGKTTQFAALFGASAKKIANIAGVALSLATSMHEGYKGIRDRTGKFFGGMGSHGFNCQADCAMGWFPVGGYWRKYRYMKSSVLGRDLPNVLSFQVSGKEHMATKGNSTIQSGDADFKFIITTKVAEYEEKYGLICRKAFDCHDMFAWWVKDEGNNLRDFQIYANRAHYEAYKIFFETWNVDLDTVPEHMWFPSSIDVTNRWVKSPKDELDAVTVSMPKGYKSLDLDSDDIEEILKDEDDDIPEEDEFYFEFD